MARRDVDLVIRARDESSKAVDAIVNALNDLASGITDTEKKVNASDSAFAKLGKSLGTLEKAMRGMSSAERLGRQLDQATASSARLEAQITQTAHEVEKLAGDMAEATATTQKYRERVDQTATALDRERESLKKNQAQHAQINKELTEARNTRSQLETSERRLTEALAAQEARLERQKVRLEAVRQEIGSVETPTKRMAASFTAAGNAVEKTVQQIAETTSRLEGTRAALVSAAAAEQQHTQAVEQSGAALIAQRATIATLKQERQEQATAARQAAQAERQLSTAYTQASAALAGQQTGLTRASEALEELRKNSQRAEQSVVELAQAARGPLDEAFRSQQAAVSRINNAFQQNRKDLAALSAEIGRVGVPTREMAETMDRLNRVNRETATAYKEQQAVLRTLRSELAQTATTTTELANKQALFATSIEGGAAALGRVTAEVNAAGAASQRVVAANQRAAQSYRQTATDTKRAEDSANRLSQANDRVSESYRRQGNASRQAMSYVQRLRGEVLSLISAYGGIYGVITLLDNVVKSYQKLEAAQSRLNALTGGDVAAAGRELDFLRRTADRLGIDIGVLADEYTKFAAATNNTVIEGQKTRDIFLAIAEAGTVNRLSLDDMGGILKAVTQIASKGKIQLEELTGQLGDRLPGALQILADGLNITTEELLDLTKNGEVTSAALTNFAQELNRRYGSALGASLMGTTVLLGQLRNAATQAMLAFANSGFIEGFNQLLIDLTATMRSADFQAFVGNLGAAFGQLARVLGVLAQNFDLVVVAVTAFTGAMVLPKVVAFASRLLSMVGILQSVEVAAAGAATATAATGAAAGTAAVRVGALATAFRLLTSSTGIGLALTAIAVGLSYWSTRADEASEAMNEHRRIVDTVMAAYDRAGGSVDNWADKIQETTKLDAATNMERLRKALDDLRKSYVTAFPNIDTRRFDAASRVTFELVRDLDKQFRAGSLSADEYRKRLSDLSFQTTDAALRKFITTLSESAKKTSDAEKAYKTAQLVWKALTGSAEEQKAALDELNGTLGKNSGAFEDAASAAKSYEESLNGIKEMIPELKAEMDRLASEQKLQDFVGGLGFNNITPEALGFIRQAQQNIQVEFDAASQKVFKEAFEKANDTSKNLLTTAQRFQGFNENNPVQRNALSEFFKAANQNIDPKITAWCAAFVNAVLATNGLPDTGKLNARSFLDYGSSTSDPQPGDIVVLKRGKNSDEGHVGFFMGYTPDGGVNVLGGNQAGAQAVDVNRFNAEDVLGFRRVPTAADTEKERAKQRQATAEAIAGNAQQIAQQELINAGKERQAEIEKAIAEAKKENPNISAEEIAQITEQTGKLYDLQHAAELAKKPREDAQKAEEEVTNLLQRQQELRAQMAIYSQQGDVGMIAQTKASLEEVNAQLMTAIDNAMKMWEAVGGTEAAAAIEALKSAKLEAEQLSLAGQQNLIDWTRVGELFVSGLTNAFDRFAQAVAEGKDIGEAARDAFLQFAADFLIEIGKMIIQQTLFNLLRSFGGPFAGLGLGLGGFGAGHTGGTVGSKRIGSGNQTRRVSPFAFAAAPRFHSGTAAPLGLRPGEVPAILKENEEVLSENDPRNILNGGAAANGQSGGGGGGTNLKIFNLFDYADVISQGLATSPGEQGVMNIIKTNRGTIRDIMDHG